ncbi:hypothetical protein OGAPHI_004014 [Ogataea philodendri]|uniref:Uncharacterized protein n=1 Tax=Ogataea philodendri TaxID=1378263 RepID=A0A9P8T5E5_9ASCO|nr:uncharacterized protein OGAPHI_004014 [Ogataea philodendri]KAH3665826.1 hypothetical protein OGAPHI_004014 [Ogataea philodendri]
MQQGQDLFNKAKQSLQGEDGKINYDDLKKTATDAYGDIQKKDYKAGKLQRESATDVSGVLGLVDAGVEQQSDGWQDTVLQHERHKSLRVDLSSVNRLSELVLGSDGGVGLHNGLVNRLHQLVQSWLNTGLDSGLHTGLDVVGHFSPERGNQRTLGLQLSRRNPVAGIVSSDKRQCSVARNTLLLVQEVRVQGLEVQRKVGGLVIVLDLTHWLLTMSQLESQLGNNVLVPAVVDSSGQRKLVVNSSLEESVFVTNHGGERVCWKLATNRKTVRNLEDRVHGERLTNVCSKSSELSKDFLCWLIELVTLLTKVKIGFDDQNPSFLSSGATPKFGIGARLLPKSPMFICGAAILCEDRRSICIDCDPRRIVDPLIGADSSSSLKKSRSRSTVDKLTSHALNVKEYRLLMDRPRSSLRKSLAVIVDSFSSIGGVAGVCSCLSSSSDSIWNLSSTESSDDDTDRSLIGMGCCRKSWSLVSTSSPMSKHAIVELSDEDEYDGLSCDDD